MHRRHLLSVALLAGLVMLVPTRRARSEEPTVLADRWDVTRIGGKPAGHSHTLVRRTGTPEDPRLEMTVTSRTEIARLSEKTVVEEVLVSEERPDGTLVSMRKTTTMSANETVVEVTFAGETATLATTTLGRRREASVKVPAGTVGPWKTEQVPVEAGFREGAKHEIHIFVIDLGGPALETVTVGALEEVETLGGLESLRHLDITLDVMPAKQTTWVDGAGSPRHTRTAIAGMVIETLRGTEEQVRAGATSKEGPAEVFEGSLIRTKHLIPHARAIDEALVRIAPKRPDLRLPSFEDERQKVEAREPGGVLLVRVRRLVPAAGATGKRPLAAPSAEVAPYLVASSMLQTDDPLIQKRAAEAVGAETDAWKAAQAVERWVEAAIKDKDMSVAFASASEVCKNLEGDCTEHAVLAAALCRAAGIPARVVLGLEYLTGIFGGHAWTEVWIEGRWYAIDATLGTGSADALHLALGRLALAEGTYGREFGAFVDALGGVDVDVREVTWQGRVLHLDSPDAVVVDGSRYVNRLWGLSVDAPPGFEVQPRGPAEGLSQRLVALKGKNGAGATRRLKVSAESLKGGQSLDAAASEYARGATLEASTIDGREARSGEIADGDKRTRVAFVLDDGDSFFAFRWSPSEGEDDAALFAALLKGVDLDAEAASAPAPK